MTGRVSHRKRQYPAKENEKKPSCGTTAQQGNCHLNVFILTCYLKSVQEWLKDSTLLRKEIRSFR